MHTITVLVKVLVKGLEECISNIRTCMENIGKFNPLYS